jgi:putative colanic acid biosynthesis acetyltransferase WcaF
MPSLPAESAHSGTETDIGASTPQGRVDLSSYSPAWYDPGRGRVIRTVWYFANALIFLSPFVPFYGLKRMVLRLFGARVGHGVIIKPRVNIKYPRRLTIGDNVWIGEGAWLDSLGDIRIGANCCVSQGAYFCTGNHDWSSTSFDLIIKPIVLEEGSWVGCRATVLGGATLGSHSIISAGAVFGGEAEAYTIYQGNPAEPTSKRKIGRGDGTTDYRLV